MRLAVCLAVLVVAMGTLVTTVSATDQCDPLFHPCPFEIYLPLAHRDPKPTPTPVPTVAPFRILTGHAVCVAFQHAGLEADGCWLEGEDERGLAPRACAAWRFLIPSLGDGAGGRIYDCSEPRDIADLVVYFSDVCDLFPAWCPHLYQRANIFVMVNGDLPDARARRYNGVLQAVVP